MIATLKKYIALLRSVVANLFSNPPAPELPETHVMLDLETLGTRPGCKILAIGAVVFGPDGLGREFYTPVDHATQLMMDTPDPSTVAWWVKQSAAARAAVFEVEGAPALPVALSMFNSWMTAVSLPDSRGKLLLNIWGNGADFDNPILAEAYRRVGMTQPRSRYSNRCYRTLKNLLPEIALTRTGTHHNALDDAKTQADHTIRILQHLGVWGR